MKLEVLIWCIKLLIAINIVRYLISDTKQLYYMIRFSAPQQRDSKVFIRTKYSVLFYTVKPIMCIMYEFFLIALFVNTTDSMVISPGMLQTLGHLTILYISLIIIELPFDRKYLVEDEVYNT